MTCQRQRMQINAYPGDFHGCPLHASRPGVENSRETATPPHGVERLSVSFVLPPSGGVKTQRAVRRDGGADRRPSLWCYSPDPSSLSPGVPLWFFLSLVGRGRCAQARGDAAEGPEGAQRRPRLRPRSCRGRSC